MRSKIIDGKGKREDKGSFIFTENVSLLRYTCTRVANMRDRQFTSGELLLIDNSVGCVHVGKKAHIVSEKLPRASLSINAVTTGIGCYA